MSQKIGIVFRSTGSWYEVRDENRIMYQCRLKGKFKIQNLKVTNPIAVGDVVGFEIEDEETLTGTISKIELRKNYIIRQSVHKTAHGHLIATNMDQAILIVTLTFPKTSLGFIDRFLVSSEAFRIPTILVFNKIDLADDDDREMHEALMYLYESLGYKCLLTSTITGEGMDKLKEILDKKYSLFSGHSGVGKSSLLNNLVPELDLATSEISTFANKGVHTTTFAEMFEIWEDTFLIDTPGIKELGLIDLENEHISHYFPEMRKKLGDCKFHNCQHINEPKCAIKDAVSNGEISESRYASYISMMEGNDNRR